MFCEFCGETLPEGAVFCPSCGARANKIDAAQEASAAVNDAADPVVDDAPDQLSVTEPLENAYQAPQYAAPAQPSYQQPQYNAPAQPSYQQPQYAAPAQPSYQAPRYNAPAQTGYQQPQYGAPVQQNYQAPQYGAPVRPQYGMNRPFAGSADPARISQGGFTAAVLFAVLSAAAMLVYAVMTVIDIVKSLGSSYARGDYGNYLYMNLGETILCALCFVAFFFCCLQLKKKSAVSAGIPLLVSLIPLLKNLAAWIFKFKIFGVSYSFSTIDTVMLAALILGVILYLVTTGMSKDVPALKIVTALLMATVVGIQIYNLIDFLGSPYLRYYGTDMLVSVITNTSAYIFSSLALAIIPFAAKKN